MQKVLTVVRDFLHYNNFFSSYKMLTKIIYLEIKAATKGFTFSETFVVDICFKTEPQCG